MRDRGEDPMTDLSTEQRIRERFIDTQLHPEQSKAILKHISALVGSADGGAYISSEDFGAMLLDPWQQDEESPYADPALDTDAPSAKRGPVTPPHIPIDDPTPALPVDPRSGRYIDEKPEPGVATTH